MNGNQPQRYGGLLGVVGGALVLVGLAIASTVEFLAAPDEIVTTFVDDSSRILAGGQIAAIGFILLMAFGAVLYRRVAAADPEGPLAPMVGAGFAICATAGLGAVAAWGSAALRAAQDDAISAEAASAIADLANVMVGAAAPVGLGLAVGATSIAALKFAGIVPRWLAYVGLVLTVGLMILPINWAVGPVGLVWVIGTGVSLSWGPQPVASLEPAAA